VSRSCFSARPARRLMASACRCQTGCTTRCGCRGRGQNCFPNCACRGRCANGSANAEAAANTTTNQALEALKLNNAILNNIVQLGQLQGALVHGQPASIGAAVAPAAAVPAPVAAPPAAAWPSAAPAPQLQGTVAAPAVVAPAPSSPASAAAGVGVPAAAAGTVAAAPNGFSNILTLPSAAPPVPQSTEHIFWSDSAKRGVPLWVAILTRCFG
jgi:hypothetical protein